MNTEPCAVLVVDDNPVNCDVCAGFVESLGHSPTLAYGGAEALEQLRANSFDLVLLDLMMPEIDGMHVLQQMKANPELSEIPVLVISVLDDMATVLKCIELGADDHIPKPFEPVFLRTRIKACIERKLLRNRDIAYRKQIEFENQRYDELLHALFPNGVVSELKNTHSVEPRRYDGVAVLFCDIVDFTAYCRTNRLPEIVANLQQLVERCEEIAIAHRIDKIKTIGDAFMGTAGLFAKSANPVLDAVRCGQDMIAAASQLPPQWQVRVGIEVGPVLAGVIGRRQYLFDVWGDTVNTAARVESSGVIGHVTLSADAWHYVKDVYRGESMGVIEVKGRGGMELFRVDAPLFEESAWQTRAQAGYLGQPNA